MPTVPQMPAYMKRYMFRLTGFMLAYVGVLIGGLSLARGNQHLPTSAAIALALLTALPICGVFWAIYRLLVETDDEYQRLLLTKQTLLATALMLVVVTIWQFLEVYDVLATGPQWVGAIWFAMLGLAAPVTRWRA